MNFPSQCPYCGKDNVQNKVIHINELDNVYLDHSSYGIALELHKCVHCQKPIFLAKNELKHAESYYNSEILFYYPTIDTVNFPNRIKDLSPNAHKTYEQTIKAKEQGFDMLVGAGLRIALEWLVWDYLIKVKGCEESAIEKLSLAKRIALMSRDFYTEVCTRLVRLFGNDSVHVIKELDFSADEVIEIFEMLCALIDGELQIKEVNDRIPKKS